MWKPGTDRPGMKRDAKAGKKEDDTPLKKDDSKPQAMKAPVKLSQKTLAMKFMQRKKTTEARRIAAVRKQKSQDTWENGPENDDVDNCSKIICMRDVSDPSLPLLFGRRSYGGFNKGIEDEFKEASRALRFLASEERELREEVSAEEMTSRMLKYTGLARRKGGSERLKSIKRQRK
ncbi:M-phase phosphoprotein 6 [Plasmopara halstedii]|uniref:M-phase phosphoprotein 6 n=1 Tax=Plasmopara halstedii TaxID=4781 RepID=A0A0N7L5D0_PLAHL|nr:M-phase phosphoprotein 6 [Plasmopara halstedii]CEG41131.1 M-phase phosphoprotein 6 [Plasmopara halstedii]|eukprot:XP_024577500.1 M-phase phosphoprotein 6 [Plasmopara halstedii]